MTSAVGTTVREARAMPRRGSSPTKAIPHSAAVPASNLNLQAQVYHALRAPQVNFLLVAMGAKPEEARA